MGQYHVLVNIDKRQFVNPHGVGNGLKLHEQARSECGIPDALHALLAVSNGRGGGDYADHDLIGSWGGDRIAIVGDYAEDADIDGTDASRLYSLCFADPMDMCRSYEDNALTALEQGSRIEYDRLMREADYWREATPYEDITASVRDMMGAIHGVDYRPYTPGSAWQIGRAHV